MKNALRLRETGFTLIEMAFVLLIIGLLTRTAIGPLGKLQEHRQRQQVQHQLQDVRDAVFAYLVAYGALPCPIAETNNRPQATQSTQNGFSSEQDVDVCKNSNGFVPAYALGLGGDTNTHGALLDPWNREYRYAVSLSNQADAGDPNVPDWTTSGEASNVGIAKLSADIVLCHASGGKRCTGNTIRSNQIAFVVMSAGSDASAQGVQAENLDNDNQFVVAEESIVLGAQYDDHVVWGSAADVMYHLLKMGWLP